MSVTYNYLLTMCCQGYPFLFKVKGCYWVLGQLSTRGHVTAILFIHYSRGHWFLLMFSNFMYFEMPIQMQIYTGTNYIVHGFYFSYIVCIKEFYLVLGYIYAGVSLT